MYSVFILAETETEKIPVSSETETETPFIIKIALLYLDIDIYEKTTHHICEETETDIIFLFPSKPEGGLEFWPNQKPKPNLFWSYTTRYIIQHF